MFSITRVGILLLSRLLNLTIVTSDSEISSRPVLETLVVVAAACSVLVEECFSLLLLSSKEVTWQQSHQTKTERS